MGASRLRAKGSLDLDGFFDRIEQLLKHAWGEDWGTFSEAETNEEIPESVKLPLITYELIQRVPSLSRSGHKEIPLDSQPDPEDPRYRIDVWTRWFECEVEFKVFHKSRRAAREVAENFELLLDTWRGYFKDLGVTEFVFQSEVRPEVRQENRQTLAIRTLRYLVIYERKRYVRHKSLVEVLMKIGLPKESLEERLVWEPEEPQEDV